MGVQVEMQDEEEMGVQVEMQDEEEMGVQVEMQDEEEMGTGPHDDRRKKLRSRLSVNGSNGDYEEVMERDQGDVPVVEQDLYENVVMPVKLVYANDMAHIYSMMGLSGASGCFPSPFTLVTKGHLAEHATNSLPHNWEELACIFLDRNPEHLLASSAACSQDTRNQGDPAKNARHHCGSKAPPMLPFPKDLLNLRLVFATFLLHVDLGVLGKWLPDHMIMVCRIMDKTASEGELATLSDLLAGEQGEELEEEQDVVSTAGRAPLHEGRQRHAQVIAEKATELELVKAELNEEAEIVMKEEVMLRRLEAVVKGPDGVKELEAIGRKEGASYLRKKFQKECEGFSCRGHCLLTGMACA
jgi:hypothetical protein